MQQTENPFIIFAQQILSQADANRALSYLQQKFTIDTNMLLFCCWTAYAGYRQLGRSTLELMLLNTSPWHNQIIIALRKIRQLILQSSIKAPWKTDLQEKLREKELIAHNFEQLMLTDALMLPITNRTNEQKFADASKNILTYLHFLKIGLSEQDIEAITKILKFVFPDSNTSLINKHWSNSLLLKSAQTQYAQLDLEELML